MNSRNSAYRRSIISLVMWLIMAFHGGELMAQDGADYLKATARMEAGYWQEALDLYQKALDEESAQSGIYARMGELSFYMGDQAPAIQYLQKAEALQSGSGSYQLARIYALRNEFSKSAAWLEKHLQSPMKRAYHDIHTDTAFRNMERGPEWRALWKKDWYSDEEVQLREVRYLMRSGEHLSALEMLDQSLDTHPERTDLRLARADLLHEMNQVQAAERAYDEVLKSDRKAFRAYYGRAQARISRKKYQLALDDLESAYRLRPEQLNLLSEMSRTALLAGNDMLARKYIGTYLAYHEFSAEAWYLAGEVDRLSGKYLDALEKLNHCLELDQTDPRFYSARGMTYLETGTLTYAIKDLGMSLDLDPSNPEVWFQRGVARMKAGDAEGARRDWQKAERMGHKKALQQLDQ